jgi:hypothetical protein
MKTEEFEMTNNSSKLNARDQQGSTTTEDRTPFGADTAENGRSSLSRSRKAARRPTDHSAHDQEELQAATYAALRAHATSDDAKALVAKLAAMVEDCTIKAGLRKNKRTGTANKLEYATGAFLADLLRPLATEEPNGWVYRSLKKTSFTGAAVTRRTFEQLVDGLKGLAFLDHVPGHKVAEDRYEDSTQYASRFCATQALLRFCSDYGVEPTKAVEHFEFEYDLPKHPVELRARKDKDYFGKTVPTGRVMEFERTEAVEKMENRVRELNAFFAKQTLRGGSHHGYVRIFSNGDDQDFDWNKGGRFYSQHFKDSYQVIHNTRRRMMTINGEPVAEIDISASYLTIFLSMHGIQLDTTKDPYEVPGFPGEHRTAVKQWFVATFGNTKPIRRWPPRMLKDKPELSQYRVATITDAIMSKYPAMATWGFPLDGRIVSWADLMFWESDIMFGAMLKLMYIDKSASLSVHDSLIVPASKVEVACDAITRSMHAKHRVVPILKINPPLTSPQTPRENQRGQKEGDRRRIDGGGRWGD